MNFKTHQQAESGKTFCSLQLQGGVEPVQSKTGRYYLTVRSCWISTTFTEDMCRGLLGTSLPGNVVKVPCQPYEYTAKDTGEILTLDYTWEYQPECTTGAPAPEMMIPQHLVVG